jgi:hypothetical protein
MSISGSSSSSSQMSEQEVWVEVRQNSTVSSSSSSAGSKMLVLKGVESWGSSNIIAEFLQVQMQRSRSSHCVVSAPTLA